MKENHHNTAKISIFASLKYHPQIVERFFAFFRLIQPT